MPWKLKSNHHAIDGALTPTPWSPFEVKLEEIIYGNNKKEILLIFFVVVVVGRRCFFLFPAFPQK